MAAKSVGSSMCPVAFLAFMFAAVFDLARCQSECRVGQTYHAVAGEQKLWPKTNPALVAPIQVKPSYPEITYPLMSEFTGTSLALTIPASYVGGFTLVADPNVAGASFQTEQYLLKRIELRMAGQAPEGIGQVLSHVFEAVLLHKQVGGSYWAEVQIPFQVSTVSAFDPLFPIVYGAEMPTIKGELQPMVLSSAQALSVASMYGNTTFLNYWAANPSNCAGYNASTRKFMRSQALTTGYESYKQLLLTLAHAPGVLPLESTDSPWIVNSCDNATGTCTSVKKEEVSAELTSALETQSNDVLEVRERKQLMDVAYDNLVTNTTDTVGHLQVAISARQDLGTANSELIGIMATVANLEAWQNASNALVFDADMPPQTSNVIQSLINASLEAANSNTAASTSNTASGATLSSLQSSAFLAPETSASANGDKCDSIGKSPVDIKTARAVDPGVISPELREPLKFIQEGVVAAPKMKLLKAGNRMRVASDEHLGSIVFGGLPHPISYVDVVVPGEHAVNGLAGDAEVQLVHVSPDAGSAIAVSLPLRLADDDNSWIGVLLQDTDQSTNQLAQPLTGMPIDALHGFLGRGSVDRYFRYDGTLTSPPCTSTQWVVVDEPGSISQTQLSLLKRQRSEAPGLDKPRQRFHASLVAVGTTRLVSQVSATGLSPVYSAGKASRNNLRKRRIGM